MPAARAYHSAVNLSANSHFHNGDTGTRGLRCFVSAEHVHKMFIPANLHRHDGKKTGL